MNVRFKVDYQGSELEFELVEVESVEFALEWIDEIRYRVNELVGEKIKAMADAGEKKIDDHFNPTGIYADLHRKTMDKAIAKAESLEPDYPPVELVQTCIRKWHEEYEKIQTNEALLPCGEFQRLHQRNCATFARAMIRLGVPEEKVTLNLDT